MFKGLAVQTFLCSIEFLIQFEFWAQHCNSFKFGSTLKHLKYMLLIFGYLFFSHKSQLHKSQVSILVIRLSWISFSLYVLFKIYYKQYLISGLEQYGIKWGLHAVGSKIKRRVNGKLLLKPRSTFCKIFEKNHKKSNPRAIIQRLFLKGCLCHWEHLR